MFISVATFHFCLLLNQHTALTELRKGMCDYQILNISVWHTPVYYCFILLESVMLIFQESMRDKNNKGPFQKNCTGSFPMPLSPDATPGEIPHTLFDGWWQQQCTLLTECHWFCSNTTSTSRHTWRKNSTKQTLFCSDATDNGRCVWGKSFSIYLGDYDSYRSFWKKTLLIFWCLYQWPPHMGWNLYQYIWHQTKQRLIRWKTISSLKIKNIRLGW